MAPRPMKSRPRSSNAANPSPTLTNATPKTSPLAQDIDAYLEREVRPWNPHAYIDYSKTKVGYEIPFTRTFYEYIPLEPADAIAERIRSREKAIAAKLAALFGDGVQGSAE